MRRLSLALWIFVLGGLLAWPALGRPGGGSVFRSHSSSRSSSLSSSRSTGSSSSQSSYRSSSSSRWPSSRSRPSSFTHPTSTVTDSDDARGIGPRFGFLIVIGLIAAFFLIPTGLSMSGAARKPKGWSTQGARSAPVVAESGRTRLDRLRSIDPDFSVILFEDFVYALYTEVHSARGTARLETLSPFLSAATRQQLEQLGAASVTTVVVGAMTYHSVDISPAVGARVVLQLEANYTEGTQSYWTLEHWEVARGPGARSRPPERTRVFACPSCGAPLERVVGGTCQYCRQVVNTGAFDWIVNSVRIVTREPRPPMLTGNGEETGTNLPTRFDMGLAQSVAALRQRDPQFDPQALNSRVGLIFSTMQHAWSTLEWHLARPYLSDNLWTAQTYWIQAYRSSGLRNVNENARVVALELVRITSDKWYDAATLRVHAAGLDYTIRDSDQAVVGGSRKHERSYTEYWTLIRGSGTKGPARTDLVCPSCGAPLSINAAGHCDYCQVKVTSGQFDWVLSRIEQDESYVA